jgi:hypothetical protein
VDGLVGYLVAFLTALRVSRVVFFLLLRCFSSFFPFFCRLSLDILVCFFPVIFLDVFMFLCKRLLLLLFGIWAKVLFLFSVKKVMGWDLVTSCEVDGTKKSSKVEVEGCGGFGMSERIRERGREESLDSSIKIMEGE